MGIKARISILVCLVLCASLVGVFFNTLGGTTEPIGAVRALSPIDSEQKAPPASGPAPSTDENRERASVALPSLVGPIPVATGRAQAKESLAVSTSIQGRCLDVEGEGISGAHVALTQRMSGKVHMPVFETTSDKEGYFRFEKLKPFETYILCGVAADLPYVELEARPGEAPKLEFARASSITGRVLKDRSDTPLAGVRVWNASLAFPYQPGLAQWLGSFGRSLITTTDANGEFELFGLRCDTKIQLAAELKGFVTEHQLVPIREGVNTADFSLSPGKRVQFRVVDWETGQPLAEAAVGFTSLHTRSILTTNKLGEFEWTVPSASESQEPRILVSAEGYCAMQVDLRAASLTTKSPIIRMVQGVQVSGRVFNPNGQILPQATVILKNTSIQTPPAGCSLPTWQSFQLESFGFNYALTDDKGYFEFTDIIPRKEVRELSASHARYFSPEATAVLADRPKSSVTRNLTLKQGGTIQGRVTLLGEGYPARIELKDSNRGKRYAKADANGLYQISGLPPGEWKAQFKKKSKANWIQLEPRNLRAGDVMRWDAELYPHGVRSYSGRVRFSDGTPIANNVVHAKSGEKSFASDASCKTDADGFFRIELPFDPNSYWQFNTRVHGFIDYSKSLRHESEFIELEFPRLGKIGFRLLEEGTGNSLPLHSLGWRESASQRWTSLRHQSFEDGIYWVHLPVGLVDLRATTNTSRHYDGTLRNIQVTSERSQVWDLVLERGILLEIQFASAEGVAGLPYFGQPRVELLGIKEGVTYGSPTGLGTVSYTPLKPGQIRIQESDAVEFEPSLLDIYTNLEQVRQVTWRITNPGLYEQLREEHERMQDSLQIFTCGYF